MNSRWLSLAIGAALLGCGHTLPEQSDLGRASGPWNPGPPEQLTAERVNILGLSSDGNSILIGRHDSSRVTGPDGQRRSDSMEQFLGLLPARGGSGIWEFSDERASQRDTINNITSAALANDGSLLYQEASGPDQRTGYHFPIRWHAELYLSDTANTSSRRMLLQLFDEEGGQPLVPPGTINWLLDLAWVDSGSFVALGAYRDLDFGPPLAPLVPIGVVHGQIARDGATLVPVPGFVGSARFAITANHRIIGVDQRSHVVIVNLTNDAVELDAAMPAPAANSGIVAVGCFRGSCMVVSHQGGEPVWQLWRVDPTAANPIEQRAAVAGFVPGNGWISPADGSLLVAGPNGALRIELPAPN